MLLKLHIYFAKIVCLYVQSQAYAQFILRYH